MLDHIVITAPLMCSALDLVIFTIFFKPRRSQHSHRYLHGQILQGRLHDKDHNKLAANAYTGPKSDQHGSGSSGACDISAYIGVLLPTLYNADGPGGYMLTGLTIPWVDVLGSKEGFSAHRPWMFEDMDIIKF